MHETARILTERLDGTVKVDEPMSRHTTYRIGGPADLFVECASVSDVAVTTSVLSEHGIEWTVLGKGSNVLVSDQGYRGAVLVLGSEFRRHVLDGTHLSAGAGAVLGTLVQEAFKRGLTGLEFAVGIPGTFGGAVVGNAGTRDDWIGSRMESVTLYEPGQGLHILRSADVEWGYRSSSLLSRGIILEASLKLETGDSAWIRRSMEAALNRRKRSQPLRTPNAGSVFKNPEGESVGRLIEEAGLKGLAYGGAMISDVHANFIVNVGGATASDVLRLMRTVMDSVRESHGIELQPEIRFLGSFDA